MYVYLVKFVFFCSFSAIEFLGFSQPTLSLGLLLAFSVLFVSFSWIHRIITPLILFTVFRGIVERHGDVTPLALVSGFASPASSCGPWVSSSRISGCVGVFLVPLAVITGIMRVSSDVSES